MPPIVFVTPRFGRELLIQRSKSHQGTQVKMPKLFPDDKTALNNVVLHPTISNTIVNNVVTTCSACTTFQSC